MTVNKITNAPTQNETIEKINEIIDNLGGGGTTEVFVATYGTTTRSEIYTARDNGLVCICIYNDKTYYLSRGAIFCETEVENGYVRIVYIDANEVWRTDNFPVVISVNNTRPTAGNVNISVPTKTSDLTNDSGYITGINSSDVTTALGYTPYDSSNPSGYTSNVGTVTSVNNVAPVNGNVSLTIPQGTVTSVNNTSPDANGNVTIATSSANYDSTNERITWS